MSEQTEREALIEAIQAGRDYYAREDVPEDGLSEAEQIADFLTDAGFRRVEQGSCWDQGPVMTAREGECTPIPPLCVLPYGHGGAHRGDRKGPGIATEWIRRPARSGDPESYMPHEEVCRCGATGNGRCVPEITDEMVGRVKDAWDQHLGTITMTEVRHLVGTLGSFARLALVAALTPENTNHPNGGQ